MTAIRFDSGGLEVTPTQRRMLDLLADGEAHPLRDLHACLSDTLGARTNLGAHVTALRKKLWPLGWDLISERHLCGTYYRLRPSIISTQGC